MNVSVRNAEEIYQVLQDCSFDGSAEPEDIDLAYAAQLNYSYEPAMLPPPFKSVHLAFNRKAQYLFGVGVITAQDSEVFEGSSRSWISDIDKLEGYEFLSTRLDRYSGYILLDGVNQFSIDRFLCKDDDDPGDILYPSLRIQAGVNGTEPILFPKGVDEFRDIVSIVEDTTNRVLRNALSQNMDRHSLEYWVNMELPLQAGNSY